MPANVDAMVRNGQDAFKAGNKEEARALLLKAAELDPYNEEAWLWLSAVVDGTEDQRTCLENVLAINPENERARKGLQALTEQEQAAPPPTPTAEYTPPNSTSTSVEWDLGGIPTSSASAQPTQPELSDEDYDAWLANLNLPQSGGTPSLTSAEGIASSPFGDVNVFDDDIFNAGPFSADDMEDVFTPNAGAVSVPAPAAQTAPPPPTASAPPAPAAPKMSPGREQSTKGMFDDSDVEVNTLFANFDEEYTDEDLSELDAAELFGYIPAEIKPTRLPGTREHYPFLVTFGLVLLVILNLGAAALLVFRLVG